MGLWIPREVEFSFTDAGGIHRSLLEEINASELQFG